jgi:hypothetical protein
MFGLGYSSSIRVRWYTPILCRLFGDLQTDPTNGVRVYTYRGVSLMCSKKEKS